MTFILLILLVAVLVAPFGYVGKASAQTTFIVSNQQAKSLGQVTVSTASNHYYVTVPGSSTDTVTISDTATSITINGQAVPQGQQAYVTLPDQTVVAVMWETKCDVVVVDKDEIQ